MNGESPSDGSAVKTDGHKNPPGYVLEEKLGEGGMGVVYRARRKVDDRWVTVKFLSRDLARDNQYVKRFFREFRSARDLDHDGIVRAIEAGEQDGGYYYVMEYVDGDTLDEVLRKQRPLGEDRVIQVGIEVAEALEHARNQGIVHRDIKPSNIILNREGHVRILDLGLAKPSGNLQDTLTEPGEWVGTPHYMSPEQAIAEGTVDSRTDVYALGVVMYEMVVGDVPFDGDSPLTVLTEHLNRRPEPPGSLQSTVGDGLNRVILKCLEKEPEQRYQAPGELVADLKRVRQNEEPGAPVPTPPDDNNWSETLVLSEQNPGQSKEGSPFWRRAFLLLAGFGLLLIAGAGGWGYYGYSGELFTTKDEQETGEPQEPRQRAQEQKRTPLYEHDGKLQQKQKMPNQENQTTEEPFTSEVRRQYDFSSGAELESWVRVTPQKISYLKDENRLVCGNGGMMMHQTSFQNRVCFDVVFNPLEETTMVLSLREPESNTIYLVSLPVFGSEQKARLRKWQTGDEGMSDNKTLDWGTVNLTPGQKMHLRLKREGNTLSASLNDEQFLSAEDDTLTKFYPAIRSLGGRVEIHRVEIKGKRMAAGIWAPTSSEPEEPDPSRGPKNQQEMKR